MTVTSPALWPLSAQVAQEVRAALRSGQIAPGERAPSQNELADEFAVSVDTAKRALGLLAAEGLLTRRRGVGSIAADVAPAREVTVTAGTKVTARIPRRGEAFAHTWVPVIVVAEPGQPERTYPADQVSIVTVGGPQPAGYTD